MGFNAAQAARLSGCTRAQLRHWSSTGLVAPSDARGQYDFRDLVSLRVVRSLLAAGVSTARVRLAVSALRADGCDLANVRIVTDGRAVTVCHDDGQILDALRAGQLALFVGVDAVAAAVEAEVRTFTSERAAFVERLQVSGVAH